ncbi:MAG TPA: hypothetical protein VMZ11_09115 [Mycobacteriales bacterium]|nr:hypothetical protein [Mycobacteriales bacterium]
MRGRRGQAATPPRVDALDAFLREVDDLRLTLETDLTLAASAVEQGAPQVASDILGSDRDALHRFEERALDQLAGLEQHEHHRRLRMPAHAGPILVAAALVGVLAGVAPSALAPTTEATPQTVAATDSLQRLQELAQSGDTDQVRAASVQLHAQLASVLANAKSDPEAAQTALLLLTYEQSAIVRSGDSRELADVLLQSRALARAIVAALPAAVRPGVARPGLAVAPKPASASPKPAPKPSPTASPATKPAPSSKPSATSSPTPASTREPYPLPSAPLAH